MNISIGYIAESFRLGGINETCNGFHHIHHFGFLRISIRFRQTRLLRQMDLGRSQKRYGESAPVRRRSRGVEIDHCD